MNKIYKPTILRILTNSTFNCIMIVLFIIIGVDLFNPNIDKTLLITGIGLLIVILLAIIVFTIQEYRFTYLEIKDDEINQNILSSKNKSISLKYDEITNVTCENYSLRIYYNDKKLTLDYYKEYKEISELIQKKMNK